MMAKDAEKVKDGSDVGNTGGKNEDQRRALQELATSMEKSFGKGAVMIMDDAARDPIAAIASGSLALDAATGIGGYPRGRIIEIFGPESSGKTTLTLHAIAQVQALGGAAAFIDAEHAFDLRYAKAIGVDPSRLVVSQPDYGEQALEIAETLARSQVLDLVVIDSVAALVPRAEVEGEMGDVHMGLQARLMSQGLRKLTSCAHKTGTTFLFINQLRQKIGVVFGNPETTPGGNALKFFASLRLDVRRIGKVAVGEESVGNRTRVKVVKNKCAPPFCEAEFDIRWGLGIDVVSELVDIAADRGALEKNGAYYAFEGKTLGQGRERARTALIENPELRRKLEASLRAHPSAPPIAAPQPSEVVAATAATPAKVGKKAA